MIETRKEYIYILRDSDEGKWKQWPAKEMGALSHAMTTIREPLEARVEINHKIKDGVQVTVYPFSPQYPEFTAVLNDIGFYRMALSEGFANGVYTGKINGTVSGNKRFIKAYK